MKKWMFMLLVLMALLLPCNSFATRYIYQGVFQDQSGNAVSGGTVSIYLAGTTTPAAMYTASTGGTAVYSVTSNSAGKFSFYVNLSEFAVGQKFDITLSKTNFTPQTYYDIVVKSDSAVSFADIGWISSSEYTDVNEAIADCSGRTLVIGEAETLSANLTVPSGCHVEVTNSGSITKASTYTVTFQTGSSFNAPPDHQVFTGFAAGDITGIIDANLKWFGAVGDNSTDDTTAWQIALANLKAASGELIIPYSATGYKVTSTLEMNQFVNVKLKFASVGYTAANQQLQWWGAANQPVLKIYGSPGNGIHIENISINGKADTNRASSGIQIGDTTLGHQGRGIFINNPMITQARYGINVGMSNTLVDAASVNITNPMLFLNVDAGLRVDGPNCVVETRGAHYSENGYAPTTDATNTDGYGAQTYLLSGQLIEYNRTSAGKGATIPANADIWVNNGVYGVYGAWSDTHGYFLYEVASLLSQAPPVLSGVRHYEATMAIGNTPNSVRLVTPGAKISQALLYGNVVGATGLGGYVIADGINFVSTGVGTFTGDLITTQTGLMRLGNVGNTAQMFLGGGGTKGFTANQNFQPSFLINKQALAEVRGKDLADSGYVISHANASTGAMEICVNCYDTDGTFTNYKAMKTGNALILRVTPTGLASYTYNFPDTTNPVAIGSFTSTTTILDNVKIGNGTPDQAQDGEDLYVNGKLEVDEPIHAEGGVVGGLAITDDVATAGPVYPVWVTANTGYLPLYTSSTKLAFYPSIGKIEADLIVVASMEVGVLTKGVQAGVTGYQTGGQANAVQITKDLVEISVCVFDVANCSVKLPTAVAGYDLLITNHGAGTADVFPFTGANDKINEGAIDAAKTLAADESMRCFTYDTTNWECLTLAR